MPRSKTIELGEIEVSVDEEGNLAAVDEYVDSYQTADFLGSAVSLLADYNSTAVAERRGNLVDAARRAAEADSSPCWPGCMASELAMVPVFRYDKVLIADDSASLGELDRQLAGVDGFAARTLAAEVAALRDAGRFGDKDAAWRPVLPQNGRRNIVVRSVIDPVIRHCTLPDEACGSLRIDSGKFSRPADAPPVADRARLLPGDRAELVRTDVADPHKPAFEDFVPDAKAIARRLGIRSPGHADRVVHSMGLAWSLPFVKGLRDAAHAAARKRSPSLATPLHFTDARRAPRGDRLPEAVPLVHSDVEGIASGLLKRLDAIKRPKAKKKTKGGAPDGIVRVYRDPNHLAADELNPDALYGPEFDDTPRSLLAQAMAAPSQGRDLRERIRDAATTRLSARQIDDVARGGRAIAVGERVVLVHSGVEQVFMRARETGSGALFWALQSTRASANGQDPVVAPCDPGTKVCYPLAPSDSDIDDFRREILIAASERLRAAGNKFSPDQSVVTDARNAHAIGGAYRTADYDPLRKRAQFSADRQNTHETAFRPESFQEPDTDGSVADLKTNASYRQLAAGALLAVVFPRGVRLPKNIAGTAWLVRLAIPDHEPFAALDGGGGSDPLRLKFLVETALGAAALAVILDDTDPEEAETALARADVSPFMDSQKAAQAWSAAVAKKLLAADIAARAESLRARSPLLDHVAQVLQTAGDAGASDVEFLPPSKLVDWNGFRPTVRDMGRPDDARWSLGDYARDVSAQASDTASVVGQGGDMSEALRLLGLAETDASRAAAESFLAAPTADGIRAVRNGTVAAFALLGRIASGKAGDETASFKRTGQNDAMDVLKRTADMRPPTAGREVLDWARLAREGGSEIGRWMARDLETRLKTAAEDVDVLLARMAAAREAIKNEKIEFYETAIDDDMRGTLAELRALGLQTLDDQILAYDAAQAEDGGTYDTMDAYEDDAGVDYD